MVVLNRVRVTAAAMATAAVLAAGAGTWAGCTQQQAQVAQQIIPIVTKATCQIVEDLVDNPLVTLLCNAVDGQGNPAPQQKVQVSRESEVYVSLKAAQKPGG